MSKRDGPPFLVELRNQAPHVSNVFDGALSHKHPTHGFVYKINSRLFRRTLRSLTSCFGLPEAKF